METPSQARRYELDGLRVLAILAVFIYHTGRFFDPASWYVKNSSLHPGLLPVMKVFELWGMPLLFVIAGAGVYYSLGKRGAGAFLGDRALRLMVPVAVGVFSHVMLQVYLERLTHGEFRGSFFAFIPHYFEGLYAFGGNFAWMGLHLWFLEMLFVFSLFLLPLFIWLRRGRGRRFLGRVGDRLAFGGGVYMLGVPVVLLLAWPDPGSPLTGRVFGGWSLVGLIPFFVNGFLLVSHERLYAGVARLRWVSLSAAAVLTLGLGLWYARASEPVFGTAAYVLTFCAYGLSAWSWVLAVLGFSARRLNRPVPFLAYANEAVLPFYIMHQSVLLSVGYFMVKGSMPDGAKWLIIAAVSFVICAGLYELLVRRVGLLRFLFGMKPRGARRAARGIPE